MVRRSTPLRRSTTPVRRSSPLRRSTGTGMFCTRCPPLRRSPPRATTFRLPSIAAGRACRLGVQLIANRAEQAVVGERPEQERLSSRFEPPGHPLIRIARQEQHPGFRVRLDQPLAQRESVHIWHRDIGHQQLDRSAVVRREAERLVAVGGLEQLVPLTLEHTPDMTPDRRSALDEQDRLARWCGCRGHGSSFRAPEIAHRDEQVSCRSRAVAAADVSGPRQLRVTSSRLVQLFVARRRCPAPRSGAIERSLAARPSSGRFEELRCQPHGLPRWDFSLSEWTWSKMEQRPQMC